MYGICACRWIHRALIVTFVSSHVWSLSKKISGLLTWSLTQYISVCQENAKKQWQNLAISLLHTLKAFSRSIQSAHTYTLLSHRLIESHINTHTHREIMPSHSQTSYGKARFYNCSTECYYTDQCDRTIILALGDRCSCDCVHICSHTCTHLGEGILLSFITPKLN